MEVLVTGGSGFLGKHLVKRLLGDGHGVRVLDISDPGWDHRKVEFIASSMTDEAVLNTAVAGCDAVIHLASSVVPKTSNDDPLLDVETNLVGTLRLLNACVAASVQRFVFPSSGGTIYGETKSSCVDELHPTNPTTSYGIVKLAIEKYLSLYAHLHGLRCVALRISNLYGEGQRHDTGLGVIASFCHGAATGKTVEIWGDGSISRDFVYVGDVVDAICSSLDFQGESLVANIGSGESVSLNEILDLISELSGEEVSRKYLSRRDFDVQRTCLDVTLAADALGWRPKTDLRDGISRVLKVVERESQAS